MVVGGGWWVGCFLGLTGDGRMAVVLLAAAVVVVRLRGGVMHGCVVHGWVVVVEVVPNVRRLRGVDVLPMLHQQESEVVVRFGILRPRRDRRTQLRFCAVNVGPLGE